MLVIERINVVALGDDIAGHSAEEQMRVPAARQSVVLMPSCLSSGDFSPAPLLIRRNVLWDVVSHPEELCDRMASAPWTSSKGTSIVFWGDERAACVPMRAKSFCSKS